MAANVSADSDAGAGSEVCSLISPAVISKQGFLNLVRDGALLREGNLPLWAII